MMEDLICKGTPAEIAEAITAQRARLGFFVEQRGEGALIYIVSHSLDEGPYLLPIHLPFALIGPAPDGRSLLTSHAEGDPKPTQWWESLISELGRLGWLASTSEPAQAERTADAPKIGAPRLAELEDSDPRAIEKKAKLRKYLECIYRDHLSLDFAAKRAEAARTTLERYRRDIWPEVETEVKAEIEAKAQKVRKA